jgi:hypothetical protein
MSNITIEELQKQIAEQAEASSKRAREQELAHQKKLEDLKIVAQEELHKMAEEAEQKRLAREAAALEEKKRHDEEKAEEFRRRQADEQILNAALEREKFLRKQLETLQAEQQAKAFAQEQNEKRAKERQEELERTLAETRAAYSKSSINVEHPQAPDNKGNAVEGTDGRTPSSPAMSPHLRQILRQHNRS